ncbi:MAG: hypothetical protein ACKVIX_09085 [Sphingomonadales bacterium]
MRTGLNKTIFLTLVLLLFIGCTPQEPLPKGPTNFVSGQLAKYDSNLFLASQFFEKALLDVPKSEPILQEAFSLALMNGYYEKAVDLAYKIDEVGGINPSVSMMLALENFKNRDFEKVTYYLTRTKGAGFGTLVSPIIKAWVSGLEGYPVKALEELEVLKEIFLFKSFGAEHAAYIMENTGNEEAAEKSYLSLLSNNKLANTDLIFSYGTFLEKIGRKEDALTLYNSFLKALPLNRGLSAAIDRVKNNEISKSVAQDPDLAISMALLRIANELTRDKTNRTALLYAQLGVFMAPKYETGLLLLANLFLSENQPQNSLVVLDNISMDNNYSDVARVREALAYNALGELDEAIFVLKDYLKISPGNNFVRSSLGDILRSQERFEEAIKEYDIALKNVSDNTTTDWFLYFVRGICFEKINEWSKAEVDFIKALELNPNEPQVLNYLGYSWIDRGMFIEKARGMIEEAVKQSPTDGFIIDSLGWVQFLMSEYEEAVINLEKAVKLQPEDSTLNNHLGDVYWMLGRRLEAKFQWNHALVMGPDEDELEPLKQKLSYGLMGMEAKINSFKKVNE